MKQKQIILEFNVKDHDFIIVPLALKSDKHIEGTFGLELEKGCQQIGVLNDLIEFDRNSTYIFDSKAGMVVKAFKERGMNYAWSLYRNNENWLEHVEIFRFNLNEYYSNYIQQLKTYSFEYSRICQQRANSQILGQSWKRMKTHLKNYKLNVLMKNVSGSMTLQCRIEIKNEFDYIFERETEKSAKAKPERNNHNDSELRSVSSRNSLREKNKINSVAANKTQEKEIELEVQSQIKPSAFQDEIKVQVILVSEQAKAHPILQEVGIEPNPYLPIQFNTTKQRTILSDIIEASYEQSHQFAQRTEKPTNEGYLIPQPEHISFAKTKTYHFENLDKSSEVSLKRNNSLESPKRNSKIDDEEEIEEHVQLPVQPSSQPAYEELVQHSQISKLVLEDEITQESSQLRNQPSLTKEQQSSSSNFKYILLIFVIYGIAGWLLNSELQQKLNIKKNLLGKGSKIRKRKIKDMFNSDNAQ